MSAKSGHLLSAEKCRGSEETELWQVFFKFSRHKLRCYHLCFLLTTLLKISVPTAVKATAISCAQESLFTVLCFVLKHLKQRFLWIPPCKQQCLRNRCVFYFWCVCFALEAQSGLQVLVSPSPVSIVSKIDCQSPTVLFKSEKQS